MLDGVWRPDVSHAAMLKAGVPRNVADHEAGLQTVRMRGGRFDWRWRARDGNHQCLGRYTFRGDVVVLTDGGECGVDSWEATYRLDGTTIRWSRVRELTDPAPHQQTVREHLHEQPWKRIDAPPQFPAGVYRADIPVAWLLAKGIDPETAYNSGGLQTLTFKGGRWRHRTASDSNQPDCDGSYSVTGDRVTLVADATPVCGTAAGGVLFSAASGRPSRSISVRARPGGGASSRLPSPST